MLWGLWMALARLTDEHASLSKAIRATICVPAEVKVAAPRFRLGDIATVEGKDSRFVEQLKQLELGAAPLPGQTRLFTRAQLLTRLRFHQIDLSVIELEMPESIRITRVAQVLDISQLEAFAREQLRAVLGAQGDAWQLENPPTPSAVPNGAVEFRLAGAPRVASSSATMEVVALVDGQPCARFVLRFKAPAKTRTIAVRSGATVLVRVISEGVVLEVKGIARATGALEETIPVYIPDTQKTLRAQVVEEGVVEVRL